MRKSNALAERNPVAAAPSTATLRIRRAAFIVLTEGASPLAYRGLSQSERLEVQRIAREVSLVLAYPEQLAAEVGHA